MGHTPLKMRCRNTALELICSMSVSVITSLYILGRKICAGASSSTLTVRITGGVRTCSQFHGPENAIFTVKLQDYDRDSRFARDPFKFVGEVHYGSERRASYRWHVHDK